MKTVQVVYFNKRVPPKGFKLYQKIYYEPWDLTEYIYRKTLTDKKEIEFYENLITRLLETYSSNYCFVD